MATQQFQLKLLLFCLVFTLFGGFCNGQKILTFQKSFGGSDEDVGTSIVSLPDNGFIIVGLTKSYGAGGYDILLIRTDSLGKKIWSKTYGGSADEGDSVYYIGRIADAVLTPDTNIVICSSTKSYGKGGADVYFLKIDLNGNVRWAKTFGGTGNDHGIGVINDPNGGFLITGEYGLTSSSGSGDLWLIKTDTGGAIVWSNIYGSSSFEEIGYTIKQTHDGAFLVGGYSYNPSNNYNELLIKVDKNGKLLWSTTYGSGTYTLLNEIIEMPDNSIYTGGFYYYSTGPKNTPILAKFDSLGKRLWSKTYTSSIAGNGAFRSIIYDKNKNVFNTSGGLPFSSYARIYDMRLDTSGSLVFLKNYGPASTTKGYTLQEGHQFITLPSGGFAMVANTVAFGYGKRDLYILKMDSGANPNSCNVYTNTLSPSSQFLINRSYSLTTTSLSPGISSGCKVATAKINDSLVCAPFVTDFRFQNPCSGQSIQFYDSSYYNPTSWKWDFGDSSSSSNTSSSQNPTHIYASSGSYKVKLVSGNGTVKDSLTKTITIFASPSKIATSAKTFCLGDSTKLNATTSGALSYAWTNGQFLSDSTNATPYAYWGTSTPFVVTVTNSNSCSTIDTFKVMVNVQGSGCSSQIVSSIKNTYAAVTSIDTCFSSLTIDTTKGFSIGEKILIIQMKGATIDLSNSSSFGAIKKISSAGNQEYAYIDSISGNKLFLKNALLKPYDVNSAVQIVDVLQFGSMYISSKISAAKSWNGKKGGILAFESKGNIVLSADIDVSGQGFRGGAKTLENYNCHKSDYFYSKSKLFGGEKGEGIVNADTSFERGRGPYGTGGGGGDDHNSGGGGGSNYGIGGVGGKEWSLCGSPIANGGLGGNALSVYSISSLFMGSGGGEGHGNDGANTPGTNGGGIVIMKANVVMGTNNSIKSDGINQTSVANNDGAGGAGAGGSVVLIANKFLSKLKISAAGGSGGNVNYSAKDCYGPGGGGGGGVVYLYTPDLSNLINYQLSGGAFGLNTNSSSACYNSANGADSGRSGALLKSFTILPENKTAFSRPHIYITSQPVNDTICLGNNASFSVTGIGKSITYQWQENKGSGWSDLSNSGIYSNVTTSDLTITGAGIAQKGYQYRVMLNNACINNDSSNAATLLFYNATSIDSTVKNQAGCTGDQVTFTVYASGHNITYQWQQNNGSGWTNLSNGSLDSGVFTSKLKLKNIATGMDSFLYRCVVTGCSVSATSNIAVLRVNAITSAKVSGITTCSGTNVTFSVVTTRTGTANLSYQWKISKDAGKTFSDISGAKSATYTVSNPDGSYDGYEYEVVVTPGSCSSFTSTAGILRVNSITNATILYNVTACLGTDAFFKPTIIRTGPDPLTYQWMVYRIATSSHDSIKGETSLTYNKTNVKFSDWGDEYYVLVSAGGCQAFPSGSSFLYVVGVTAASINSQTVCSGTNAVFSLQSSTIYTAPSSSPAYQWQLSTNNGFSFNNISGATASSYTVSAPDTTYSGYQYRLVINPGSSCPAFTTDASTMIVNALPKIIKEPINSTIYSGCNSGFGVKATGAGLTYQWQKFNGLTWANLANSGNYSGVTTDSITISSVTMSQNADKYRVIVSGTCTPFVASDTVMLIVDPVTLISPLSRYICPDDSAMLKATVKDLKSLFWTPGSTLTDSLAQSTWAHPAVDITYILHAQTNAGCNLTDTVRISIFLPKPPTPVIINSTVLNTSNIRLFFNDSPARNIDSFIIYRSVDGGSYAKLTRIKNTKNDQRYTLDDLAATDQQSYSYLVLVKDSCGKYSDSSKNHEPVLLQGTAGELKTFLHWKKYIGYIGDSVILQRITGAGTWTRFAKLKLTDTSYTDSSYMNCKTSLYYRILTYGNGQVSYSDTIKLSPFDTIAPAQVNLRSASVFSGSQIQVQFDKVSKFNTRKYLVYVRKNHETFTLLDSILSKNISGTTFTYLYDISTLSDTFSFRVYALDSCGNISKSTETHRAIQLNGQPADYANKLEWSTYQGFGVKNYIVQKYDAGTWADYQTLSPADSTFTDTLIPCKIQRTYRIKAIENGGDNALAYSDSISLTPFDTIKPNRPVINYVTVLSGTQTQISWTKSTSPDVRNYTIYRQDASGAWVKIDSVGDVSTYTDKTVNTTQSYCYAIQAEDSCAFNLSRLSDPNCTIVLSTTVKGCEKAIYLNWNAYSGWTKVNKYEIYRTVNGGAEAVLDTISGSTTTYKDSGLSFHDQYCYRVLAYENDGSSLSWSNQSCNQTFFVDTPQVITVTKITTSLTNGTAVIRWKSIQKPHLAYNKLYYSTDGITWSLLQNNIPATQDTFIHTGINTQTGTQSYYIVTVDSCGTASEKSGIHRNIDLTVSVGQLLHKLNWTPYKGFKVRYYYIEKLEGTFKVIDSVPATDTASRYFPAPCNSVERYRIVASGYNAGEISWSDTMGRQAIDTEPSNRAIINNATVLNGTFTRIDFRGSDSLDTYDYVVQRAEDGNWGTAGEVLFNGAGKQITYIDTVNTQKYHICYTVLVRDSCLNTTLTDTFCVIQLKGKPQNLADSLNWYAFKGYDIENYYILRYLGPNNWDTLANVTGKDTQYLHQPLPCNVPVTYKIAGQETAAGRITMSDSITLTPFDTTKPPPPTIKYATVDDGSQITLRWHKSISKVRQYELSMKTGNGIWKVVANVTDDTFYTFTSLNTPDSVYDFRIVAIDSCSANRSPNSNFHSPVQLDGLGQNLSNLLNWKAYEGFASVQKYYVYRWNNGWQVIDSVPGTKLTYLDTGLSCNVTRYYRLSALDNTGKYLSFSDTIPLTPFDTIKPPAPAIKYATVFNGSSITLYWNKSIPKVRLYELSMKSGNGSWTVMDTLKDQYQFTFTGLNTPDSVYDFRIVAIDSCASNRSPNSKFHSPVQLDGQGQNLSNLLNWKAYEGFASVQKYYINRWNNGWQVIDSVPGTKLSYLDTGLSCNVTRYYRLSALDNTGKYLSFSDTIPLTPFDTIKPPAPAIKYATVFNGSSITLYWNKSIPKVRLYELSMKSGNGSWTVMDTLKDQYQFTFTGLNTPDSVYDFRIVAIDSCAANRSPHSNFHSPVQLDGTPMDDTVKLIWKAYEGFDSVSKYYIYNYQNGWKLIDSVGGDTTEYYHKTLPCNVSQSYRIGALNSTGTFLSMSDTIMLTPFDTVKPPSPQLYYATVLPDQTIKLNWSWDPKSDVKYFEIWRSKDNNPAIVIDTVIYDSTYNDKAVNPKNSNYSYFVIAIDSCNTVNRSNPSHEDTLMNIALHSFSCIPQIDISWNLYKGLPDAPDQYEIYRSTDGINFTKISGINAPAMAYTDFNVSIDTVYYYKIRALDTKTGYSSYSDSLGLRPVIVPHPDSTQFIYSSVIKTGINDGQIFLRWNRASLSDTNAKGYHIYVFDSASNSYTLLYDEKDINTTSHIHGGINTQYRKYSYYVIAYNRCKIEGTGSEKHQPIHLSTNNQNLLNTLTWTKYAGATVKNYYLYKSDNKASAYLLGTFKNTDTTYTDTNIFCTHHYMYQVQAVLANDSLTMSDSVQINAFDTIPPPNTPILVATVVKTSKTSGQILLVYNGNGTKNRSGYHIYRKSGKGAFALIYTLQDTSFKEINWIDGINLNTTDSVYSYYVGAIDSCGNEALPADTHRVIHLKAKAYNQLIRLDWTDYVGWQNWAYKIWKRENNGAWIPLKTVGKDTLMLIDSNVYCHRGYDYRIEAIKGNDTLKSYSNESVDTAINTVPPITRSMQLATVTTTGTTTGKIDLGWNPSTSENNMGYDIYRSTDGVTWTEIFHEWQELNYTDSNLNTYGQPYYYKIQPIDSCGNLGNFTEIHKSIRLKASPGNQVNKLVWNAYEGWKVKKYLVYKDGILVGSFGKDTTSWNDTLVLCTKMYHYLVKAVCDTTTDTLITASNTDSARAYDHIAPQRVYLKTVTVSKPNKAVTISWSASTSFDVKNYYIYRKSAATGELRFIDSTDQTSYIDSSKALKDPDCYYVFARDLCGNQSPGSNMGCVIILRADNGPGYNSLNWNGYQDWKDGVNMYNVYKNEDKQGWTMIGTTTNGTVHDFIDKSPGDTIIDYCYQVEAVENPGKYNQLSRSTVVCVHQDATVFIPNTFSHYLIDGLNDKFGPKGLHIKNYTMQIYNRWGEMIYKTDKGAEWDGTFRGKDVQEGVYVYIITIEDYNSNFNTFKGNITIFK